MGLYVSLKGCMWSFKSETSFSQSEGSFRSYCSFDGSDGSFLGLIVFFDEVTVHLLLNSQGPAGEQSGAFSS